MIFAKQTDESNPERGHQMHLKTARLASNYNKGALSPTLPVLAPHTFKTSDSDRVRLLNSMQEQNIRER